MRIFFNKKIIISTSSLLALSIPIVSSAQIPHEPETLFDFFNASTVNVSTQLVGVAILFSLTFFLYGVFTYINAGSSEDKRKQGVTLITHGLIALFVMVSLWAIVSLMINTFVGDPLQYQPKIKD